MQFQTRFSEGPKSGLRFVFSALYALLLGKGRAAIKFQFLWKLNPPSPTAPSFFWPPKQSMAAAGDAGETCGPPPPL